MPIDTDLPPDIIQAACCPVCKTRLRQHEHRLECSNPDCGSSYPVIEGVPVLINEKNSLFRIRDFVDHAYSAPEPPCALRQTLAKLIPPASRNIVAKGNYARFAQALLARSAHPAVLVLGGRILGQGVERLLSNEAIRVLETDVAFGPRTALICDAHDILFGDCSFEGVIIQAVLEHVVDPYPCAEEMFRVLKSDGIVYAETPFMQQVHGGPYDFTRFTHIGHRRLFRRFEELSSGAVGGPGMALAWSYEYFLSSFARSTAGRSVLRTFARLSAWYLPYLDFLLLDRPGAYHAASGYYFLGTKSDRVVPDHEVVKGYRGFRD